MSPISHSTPVAFRWAHTVATVTLLGVAFLAGPISGSASAAGTDSISFDAVGYDRPSIDREASNYCATHGKVAAFTGQSGTRLNYDCVPSSGNASPPAVINAPVATYSSYGNGHNNPSVSYDTTRYDRQAIIAAANSYCGTLGKSAAFSGRSGSLVNYDCIPYSDAARAPVATYAAPAAPSITFEFTGNNRPSIEAEAASYCSAQGGTAVFRGQNGSRVTYDCVIGANQPYATPSYQDNSASPNAVPTITYSTAGNSQQNSDAPAIRYCAMMGKSPVLVREDFSNRTYECR